MRHRLGILLLLVMIVPASSTATAAETAAPVIVGDDKLAVTVDPGSETAEGTVTVLNSGSEALVVGARLAGSSKRGVTARTDRLRLEPGDARRMQLRFHGVADLQEPVTGALVVHGGEAASARVVTITPKFEPTLDWPQVLLIGSFVVAFGVMSIIGYRNRSCLRKRAPGPSWSFDSYATTLTALGGLLAVVLGEVTFPEQPEHIAKDTVIALNVLFAGLVVAAPFLFQALRNPKVPPTDPDGLWGFNATLLLACGVTCAAVLGQLGTLALLIAELVDDTWTTVAVVVLGIGALLALWYFAITACWLSRTDWKKLADKAKKADVAKARQAGKAGIVDAEPAVVVLPAASPRRWHLP